MSFLKSPEDTRSVQQRAAGIRLAIFDVDGVMTDGRLFLAADGTELKAVHVRDGLGLKRLAAAGVDIAVISGRPSAAVAARMAELGIHDVYMECADKPARLEALREARALEHAAIAVMGDDLPDLAMMDNAGLALTVPDALPDVRRAAHWVSDRPGGHGAVREACELIIAAREAARP